MRSITRSPDAIVVGAGVIGLSTALALVRLGLRVTVIDRAHVGPGGASWAGGGILSPLSPDDVDPGLFELLRESLAGYSNWCEELRDQGKIDPEFIRSGMQVLAPASSARWSELGGVCGIDVQDVPEDLPQHSLAPAMAWLPGVAQVRSPRLLRVLAAAVRARGGTVIEGEDVLRLQGTDRVTGVVCPQSARNAGFVVLSTGAWTDALLPDTGIRPVKGQMLLLQAKVGELPHIMLAGDRYLIPRKDGVIVAGSTLEEAGFDDAPTTEARESIVKTLSEFFPWLADRVVLAHWAGLRPAPGGRVPMIGWSESRRGLMLNTGHHRLGITLAPESARKLASLIAENGF
ncbi:MAG: NAD(P)/FAD-dependent oxidoreductase [Panacagrimonas sp.]